MGLNNDGSLSDIPRIVIYMRESPDTQSFAPRDRAC
jgi:hypothetical protein